MWQPHMAELARFHCLAVDLPGHGRSNHLPWISCEHAADGVARLIEARIPERRAHIVGLSLGGSVAHTLLSRHADRVESALIDGAGVLPWWGNRPTLMLFGLVSRFLHTGAASAAIGRALGLDEEGRAGLRADLLAASPQAFRRALGDAFGVRATRDELEAPCATLLVAGQAETAVRSSNAGLAALMPLAQARYVPGVGHGWLARKPDLHVGMVETWLSDRPLPAELAAEAAPSTGVMRRLHAAASPTP
jgi:pimeloyl-ACP methyl ester carboxylesterase